MAHHRDDEDYQLYVLLEAVIGIDQDDFTVQMQRFLAEYRPPPGRTWTEHDEARRQRFAALPAGEFFAAWRSLRTVLKRAVYV